MMMPSSHLYEISIKIMTIVDKKEIDQKELFLNKECQRNVLQMFFDEDCSVYWVR